MPDSCIEVGIRRDNQCPIETTFQSVGHEMDADIHVRFLFLMGSVRKLAPAAPDGFALEFSLDKLNVARFQGRNIRLVAAVAVFPPWRVCREILHASHDLAWPHKGLGQFPQIEPLQMIFIQRVNSVIKVEPINVD